MVSVDSGSAQVRPEQVIIENFAKKDRFLPADNHEKDGFMVVQEEPMDPEECCFKLETSSLAIVENGTKKDRLLPAVNDEHGGVIVEIEEKIDPNDFRTRLRASLFQWKLQVFCKICICSIGTVQFLSLVELFDFCCLSFSFFHLILLWEND